MNKKLLNYIDDFLYHSSDEPLQQMVFFIAKLCLISVPAAWAVKCPDSVKDRLFISLEEAVTFLNEEGDSIDYITPLFATVKVDMAAEELRDLLLKPSLSEKKSGRH